MKRNSFYSRIQLSVIRDPILDKIEDFTKAVNELNDNSKYVEYKVDKRYEKNENITIANLKLVRGEAFDYSEDEVVLLNTIEMFSPHFIKRIDDSTIICSIDVYMNSIIKIKKV